MNQIQELVFVFLVPVSLFSTHQYPSISTVAHVLSPPLEVFRDLSPFQLLNFHYLLKKFIFFKGPVRFFVVNFVEMELLESLNEFLFVQFFANRLCFHVFSVFLSELERN